MAFNHLGKPKNGVNLLVKLIIQILRILIITTIRRKPAVGRITENLTKAGENLFS